MNTQIVNAIFQALEEIMGHLNLIKQVIEEIRKDPNEIDTDKVIALLESIRPREVK